MKLVKNGFPLVLLLVAGCATQGDLVSTQRDMDEIKSRLLKMEKDVTNVGTDARQGVEKSVKGFQGDLDGLRKSQADLQANLEGMRVDLQVLSGKVDDAGNAAKKPADDLALLKEDLDRRLTSFDDRMGKIGKELEELKKKAAEAPAAPVGPEGLYQTGLHVFKGGDPTKAREVFQKFLEQYPKHDLAVNAHYWIGESWFEEKKYEQAILEFQELIKNYPGKEKVAAALLKQGMAFSELGDAKSARYVYKKLIADYPLSDEAKKGEEKLKGLK
jgi:tol-pal system protein YbgF